MALVPCLHRVRGCGRSKQPAAVGEQRPFPDGHEVRDGEMAAALATIGGADVSSSSARGRRNVFAVERVVFPIAEMSVPRRRRLRKRLRSELDAVRDLLSKAEALYSCAAVGAAAREKDGRLFAPGAAAAAAPVVEEEEEEEEEEEGGGGCSRAAKKSRKASPFAERTTRQDDRERLAGRLASMAAALPDHAVAFLQRRRVVGGADDPRGDDGDGELEMGVLPSSMKKDGALLQLKMLLDKFAPPECTPKRQEEAGDRMLPPVQEEEGVNLCGGVARIAIRDIAEEYGELVNDVGVQLLSPLQRKYVDLAEQDEYVDICGDASPVVFPANTGGDDNSNPSLSSISDDSDEATSSTDSDSSSSSPEARISREPAVPSAPEVDLDPVPPIQGKHNTQPPEPAPAAEPGENQCAATVFAVTKTPIAAPVLLLPEECRTRHAQAQPPPSEQAPEAVQIAHPEELKQKCVVAPAATVHDHITGGAPPPVVLPNESSQPAPPPVAAQIAEPQPQSQPKPQQQQVLQTQQTNDLIAMARQEGKRRAMAKARQELRELEGAALPHERIDPRDMERLGIDAFEHVVSSVRDARTAPQLQVKDGAPLRIYPGCPSILQQLGVFLKADGGDGEEEEQSPPIVVVSDGEEDMEIEDGQIL